MKDTMMRELGYTNNWIVAGILSDYLLKKQYDNYLHSNDKNIEHYRWKLLTSWIDSKSIFDNDDWIGFIKIFDEDSDKDMMKSVLISLIQSGLLKDEQLEEIENNFDYKIRKEALRQRVLNEIKINFNSYNLLKTIVEIKDNSLLLKFIEECDEIKLFQSILDENIGSRKIQNIVKKKMNQQNSI